MRQIKYYKVVEAETPDELQEMVTTFIVKAGWEPAGGVSVCAVHAQWENERKGYTECDTTYTYAQALVKYEV